MPRPQSLYHQHPDYRVEFEIHPKRVRVTLGGETIADSPRALVVRETRHAPVIYFPREDVRLEHLERTDLHSVCPFKGEASYWSIRVGDRLETNAAWTYEDPFEEVAGLRDYVSFYQDRANLEQTEIG